MHYAFADCVLDTASYRFFRGGAPVPVEPQVFDLLRVLVENAGRLVTRDTLIERVWDGRIVSEATISARINAARSAVGDTGKAQAVIRTVPRRGFELIAPVERVEPPPATPATDDTPRDTPRQTIRYTSGAGGAMIAWASSGEGPPLMYAASHVTHLELDWRSRLRRPMFDRFAENHRLIRFDIRGTGLSDRTDAGDTLDTHLADFTAVADAAGLDRFPILANLNSGAVAIRYAAENPDRVSHLVIQNGYARGRAMRGDTPLPQTADPFVQLLHAGGWGDPDNGFMRAWMSMALPSLSREDLSEMIRLVGGVTEIGDAIATRAVIDRFDCRDWLARVQAPTLVIHSRNGALHPLEEGRILAAGIPGAEFLVLESGDTVCIACDPEFDRQIRTMLDFIET